MNVAHLCPSLSRNAGGIGTAVRSLTRALGRQGGLEITVYAPRDEFTDKDLPLWEEIHTETFPTRIGAGTCYAPQLKSALLASPADIVHTHGLWTYLSVAALGRPTPLMVSPHGMLDAWALGNSSWKKNIAALLFEKRHLRRAACLHALCEPEARAIRAYGLKNPICILPNGVDLPDPAADTGPPPWNGVPGIKPADKILLYLGRLHPKKGLPNLLRAQAMLRRDEPEGANGWKFVICGWDQGGHKAQLRRLCDEAGISDAVHFAGPLFGKTKAAAFRHADAFALPSLSEGLPVVVLEAWSHGTPVLMTPECNLPEGFDTGAAVKAAGSIKGLKQGLQKLISMTDEERGAMGTKGRELVEVRFSWPTIAGKMAKVYRWILGGGDVPECVRPD